MKALLLTLVLGVSCGFNALAVGTDGAGTGYGNSVGSFTNTDSDVDTPIGMSSQPFVKHSNSDRRVKEAQDALASEGYNVTSDGIMGPQTKKAIKLYQARNGLIVTGVLDNPTQKALNVGSEAGQVKGIDTD